MKYDHYRRNYLLGGLLRPMLNDDPFAQFDLWMQQAVAADLADPTAASLATIETDGTLWQRIVLLKLVDSSGFVFFTNYQSNKGRAIELDHRASMLFPWNELERQVIVSGVIEKIAASESDDYFASRPRASQLGAWASDQSRPIEGRDALVAQYETAVERFGDGDIPRPAHWGGFRLKPQRIEFWQGGDSRLHDRFRYTLSGDAWYVERLQP